MKHSIGELPPRGEKVWYLIKQDAHEGPYSLEELSERMMSGELKTSSMVWARGWPEPLALGQVLKAYQEQDLGKVEEIVEATEPEVQIQEVVVEMIEEPNEEVIIEEAVERVPSRWPLYTGAAVMLISGGLSWHFLKPQVEISKPSDMEVSKFRELKGEFAKINRPVPIPALSVSRDFSKIWMLDKSLQSCSYEASFHSGPEDNLGGQQVSFKSQASSVQHWIAFERFSFTEGQKILPGKYQLNLERIDCEPKGIISLWQKPDAALSLSFSVDIYSGSPDELKARLDAVAKKKAEEEKRRIEVSRQAWRDIEEKFRTLGAIAAQIEQGFKGLLDRRVAWDLRLKRAIDSYTTKQGSFLTAFIVTNDQDFTQLATQDIPEKVDIMGRQPMINAHAKRIGFVSMSLIEKLQKDNGKAPNRRDLQDWLMSLEQEFGVEKENLRRAAEEAQVNANKQ